MSELTQARLKQLLHYDPINGTFTWLVGRIGGRGINPGDHAGCKRLTRWSITVDGNRYYSSHLAFLYMTGSLPTQFIDHINRDSFDDRWGNLREVSLSQNNMNRSVRSLAKTGIKGVCWNTRSGKWLVQVSKEGVRKFRAHFDDLELAELVAIEARNLYHGKFACHVRT